MNCIGGLPKSHLQIALTSPEMSFEPKQCPPALCVLPCGFYQRKKEVVHKGKGRKWNEGATSVHAKRVSLIQQSNCIIIGITVIYVPYAYIFGGFLKWWVSPTTMSFPTKNDQHLGCEMGVPPLAWQVICLACPASASASLALASSAAFRWAWHTQEKNQPGCNKIHPFKVNNTTCI